MQAELITGIEVTGETSGADAAKVLKSRGCGEVVITMGGQGVISCGTGPAMYCPLATKVPVVDSTVSLLQV